MKVISVVCPRGGIGQSACAYNIAQSFKKDSKILLIDCSDEFFSKERHFFENKNEVTKMALSLDVISQKEDKFSKLNFDYVIWNKLDKNIFLSTLEQENQYDIVVINCDIVAKIEEFYKVLNSSDEIIIPVSVDLLWKASLQLERVFNDYKNTLPKKYIVPVLNIIKIVDTSIEDMEVKVNKIKKDIILFAKKNNYEVLDEIIVFDDLEFYNNLNTDSILLNS